MLATIGAACAAARAEDDFDELELSEGRPGLIAQFTTDNGETITRVADRVVLSDAYVPLDDRLAKGVSRVQYSGRLYADLPETFVISAYVRGRLVVRVDDDVVLDSDRTDVGWTHSAPLELDFGHHDLVVDYVPGAATPELVLAWSAPHFSTETIAPRWFSHVDGGEQAERLERGRQLVRVLRCGA
ncbi:MAG: hypothetical protein KDA63_10010, partial [Planctomycetales bacterium]|nr:hypothetical protein [Planctomycetales bacterium]